MTSSAPRQRVGETRRNAAPEPENSVPETSSDAASEDGSTHAKGGSRSTGTVPPSSAAGMATAVSGAHEASGEEASRTARSAEPKATPQGRSRHRIGDRKSDGRNPSEARWKRRQEPHKVRADSSQAEAGTPLASPEQQVQRQARQRLNSAARGHGPGWSNESAAPSGPPAHHPSGVPGGDPEKHEGSRHRPARTRPPSAAGCSRPQQAVRPRRPRAGTTSG